MVEGQKDEEARKREGGSDDDNRDKRRTMERFLEGFGITGAEMIFGNTSCCWQPSSKVKNIEVDAQTASNLAIKRSSSVPAPVHHHSHVEFMGAGRSNSAPPAILIPKPIECNWIEEVAGSTTTQEGVGRPLQNATLQRRSRRKTQNRSCIIL